MTSVPVMSAGIRSGVNWMRLKSSDRHLASVLIISVLARPGHAFEDAVAPAEQRDQQLLDDLVLADDHPAELLLDVVEGGLELPHRVEVGLAHRAWAAHRRSLARRWVVGCYG